MLGDVLGDARRDVARPTAQADPRRDTDHRRDGRGVIGEVDRFAEQQQRV
jgi:hypothetical protein